jgi:predicted chitinase
MATSRVPGIQGRFLFDFYGPDDAPGIVGQRDNRCYRDSPGVLGLNDWASWVSAPHLPRQPVATGQCACNRDITLDELCSIYKAQKRSKCESFLPALNATFKAYGMNSCLRKAHFLAQVGHESGELTYVAETLPKGKKEADVYDGYKGRGLLQITYKKNYQAYGKVVNHDFTDDHRVDLEDPKWATDSAGNYWTTHNNVDLNGYADKNDLLAVTARVNGGYNGFADRLTHLKRGFTVLKVRDCPTVKIGKEDYVEFAKSDVYANDVYSFGWGCWNDPKGGKAGVKPQLPADRKAGYARYLEFRALQLKLPVAQQPTKKHYGFTVKEMDALAKEGVK